MSIYEDTRQSLPFNSIWRGVIATDPADFAHTVMVKLPDFDPNLQIGPCKWQARDDVTLPSRGDECLVIFDNDRAPWVVVWWPF